MLRHWISKEKILPHINILCRFNKNSGAFLQEHYDEISEQIDWIYLSFNPSAVPLLEQHLDKIYWFGLCANPSPDTMPLIEQNLDKLDKECWRLLSKHPHAVFLLESHLENINWIEIAMNPAAISLIKQNLEKIHWDILCQNPNAVDLIEENLDKIQPSGYMNLCKNTNSRAMHLLEQHIDVLNASPKNKYGWSLLSENPAAIPLLEKHLDKIDWMSLSSNPAAIQLLKKYLDKVEWVTLSGNPAAVSLLECHLDKVCDETFFKNPNAIHLFESRFHSAFPDEHYRVLSYNPAIFEDFDYCVK